MKNIKTFEEFSASRIQEASLKAGEESKIYVEDVKLDSGPTIKSAEILGALTSTQTEKDFKDYFYKEYGEGAFSEGEMDVLASYFLDKAAEDAEEEKDAEADAEGEGEEDPLAGL